MGRDFSNRLDQVFPSDDEKGRNSNRAKWMDKRKGKDGKDFDKKRFNKRFNKNEDDNEDDN